MTVNSLHHPNRQRFTIAHELGHFIYENNISFLYNKTKVIPKDINLDSFKFINNKHKVEDYNLSSENFAYWFEGI